MKFISGMIIGEINGIAIGIAGTVVALCIGMLADKLDKKDRTREYKYDRYKYYVNKANKEEDSYD